MNLRRTARSSAVAVDCRVAGGVAWLTIDTRRAGSVLGPAAAQALCDAVERLRLDDGIAVVVLRATGADFCRGFEAGEWTSRVDCVDAVASLAAPVIAAVDGRATAEGCELALACDLRLVSDRAAFGLPQLAEGRLPRHGATQRLPRLVGASRALEILWTGRTVRAREAVRLGLATRVAPARRLRRDTAALAAELCRKGSIALRLAKEAVRAAGDLTLDQGIRLEEDLYALLQTTADRAEGVRAFLEKRTPRFSGS